ncbi:hypothetical protein [Sanguibacter antarcticus]|uniref:Type IV pilus assembly protein PilO n=1 Tax=Sanguibacter antarcticus TaxID=372484 RepID=A0A2A9E231_9MICO|nr:hypothetical protein [Sanguibacter antarcticus]PFG33097.1 hypothetical protein ATL42_0957 [Sanguibacter antarcticus]
MSQIKSSTFILGTVLISLAILAMVWFLGASPALSDASLANDETETIALRNAELRAETAVLADEFERIDELEAELAGLRTQIPGDDEMTAFNRYVDEVATLRGVTVLAVTADPAVQVMPLAETAAAADGTTDAPAVETTEVANLYAVAVNITVLGTYDNAIQFLDDLQRLSSRFYGVQTLNLAGQEAAEASGGKPAIVAGDVEQTISGYLFVMPVDELETTTDEPDATVDAAPEGTEAG